MSTRGITPRAPLVKAGSRVLATGGTGFIGSHLVDALIEHGVRPRVLVRPTSDIARLARDQADKVKLVTGALEDRHSLTQAVSHVDTVFHLAAVTKAHTEEEYLRANAEGTQRLVQAMRAAQPRPRRLVYLSSLAAAGPARDGRPVEPGDEPHPITAYGRSKLVGEQACFAASDAFEVVMLRAPVVYGPREKDFFLLFRLAARGIVPLPAGPESVVQLVHVTDPRPGDAPCSHEAGSAWDLSCGRITFLWLERNCRVHKPGRWTFRPYGSYPPVSRADGGNGERRRGCRPRANNDIQS